MSAAEIILQEEAGIATFTLNRPQYYNALSLGCMELMLELLDEIDSRQDVRVVVIRGAGRGFCAGHDLKELRAEQSATAYRRIFETCSRMMLRLCRLRQPVIAAVHGMATAAGCQLVATADLAVADEHSRFATPGVNLGLFCSTPMVALTRNVRPKQALEMLLLGQPIDAPTALAHGLINRIAPAGTCYDVACEVARIICAKSPLTLQIGKEAFYRQLPMELSDAYAYCAEIMTQNMLSLDAKEGIGAHLDKRDPHWQGR